MEIIYLIKFADICQAMTMPICILAYLPQWLTIIKNRSSKNISLKTYLLWFVGGLLALVYALVQNYVYGTGLVLIFTTIINILCLATTASLVIYFRSNKKKEAENLISYAVLELKHTQETINAIANTDTITTENVPLSEIHV